MAVPTVIVGCGLRGRDWLREITAHPEFILAGAVDPDPAALDRFRRASGVDSSLCFGELARALDQTGARAIVVASPETMHGESIRQALDRSIGVLVEKPFTTSYVEARELVARAEDRAIPLVVAQNYRFLRYNQTVRKLLGEGVVGEPGIVIAQYYRTPHAMPPSAEELSDRILWRMSVHHVDALRWTLQREFTRVVATSFPAPWSPERPGDSFQMLAEMEGGLRVTYQSTYESRGHEFFESGQEYYQRITGTRATLHIYHRWMVLFPAGRKLPRLIRRGPKGRNGEAILLDQLHRGLRGDGTYEASGRENLGTMAALEAMVRSARESRWIDLTEVTG